MFTEMPFDQACGLSCDIAKLVVAHVKTVFPHPPRLVSVPSALGPPSLSLHFSSDALNGSTFDALTSLIFDSGGLIVMIGRPRSTNCCDAHRARRPRSSLIRYERFDCGWPLDLTGFDPITWKSYAHVARTTAIFGSGGAAQK